MATQDRPTDRSINSRLLKEGNCFSFFQVIQLLERFHKPRARIGFQGPAAEEIISLRPHASFAFPSSDVVKVERTRGDGGRPPFYRITTAFLGLYGTTSPLPTFYTEQILSKEHEEDQVRAFLDLFHHRLLSLFYRSWSKYRYYIQFENEGKDLFSRRMFAFLGLGTSGLVKNTDLPSVRLIHYAGLFTQQPRSASALEGILSDFLGDIPVEIESCTGRWVTILKEQRVAIGQRNNCLGVDCSIGEKVYDRSGGFRILIGPMGFECFKSLLPDGELSRRLKALVRLFVKDSLEFDVELRVLWDEIPPLQLSSRGQSQLGWTTWLHPEKWNGIRVASLLLNRAA